MTRPRGLLKFAPPVFGLLVLIAIIFALHHALAKVHLHNIAAALAATPKRQIRHAFVLLAVSFVIMLVYDIPGIMFAKKLQAFQHLGLPRIGLASFSAYALSHMLGAPAISAAAIRLRLYAQWGVPAAGIARIIALSGTAFSLGLLVLLGGILLLHPADVPLFGRNVSPLALRVLGALLWLIFAAYLATAGTAKPLRILGKTIPRPGLILALAQILLACADTACACAILYTVLPTASGLTYPRVLAIYLAGFAGGLVSGLPGGAGIFDTILLLGLSGCLDPASAIGAILLFRVLYYLLPASLAGICFAGHEILITATNRQRKSR